jgi:hypothetical protein
MTPSEEFLKRVDELRDLLSAYAARAEQDFARAWNKELNAASIKKAGEAAHSVLKETYQQIQEQLVDLCSAYLLMNDEERMTAREIVGTHPELLRQLHNHVMWEVDRVKSEADQDRIMRGLAAISLNDLRTDYRDVYIAMGMAYQHAYRVGAFLSIPLVKIANLSNPSPSGRNKGSMRDFFLSFETSAFFFDSVAPKLNP